MYLNFSYITRGEENHKFFELQNWEEKGNHRVLALHCGEIQSKY